MMSAHFCAAIPNFRIMEIDIDDVAWKDDPVTHPPEIENGELVIPDRPGAVRSQRRGSLLNIRSKNEGLLTLLLEPRWDRCTHLLKFLRPLVYCPWRNYLRGKRIHILS